MLSGKKIIVTGGSRGIGRATVEYLAEQGARVAFTHTGLGDAEKLRTFVAEQQSGAGVGAFVLDASAPETFKASVSEMTEFLGGLDGVVNNAGVSSDNLILRMKEEEYDRLFDINLKGAYFFTKECLRPLLKAESGSVVYVSSVVGLMGNPGQSAYAASKAGLIGLAKSLARELAARGLRVNVVAPGAIATDMFSVLDEGVQQKFLEQIPFRRFGTGKEIAEGIGFLLSDMSRYVTGQVLNISGGLYI